VKFRFLPLLAICACALACAPARAGNQKEERLAASVRAALHQSVSDAPPTVLIDNAVERDRWLDEMSARLEKYIRRHRKDHKEQPTSKAIRELLTTVHYEATRAGLDPQLVLSLIQVESRFRKYAFSKADARGYMQVMPFWVKTIGNREDNLFHMRTNLRYGCTILRHYIDLEKGNLFLALGRYNGSRGKPSYPNSVNAAWKKNWVWVPSQTPTEVAAPTSAPAVPVAAPASQPDSAALPLVAAAPSKPPEPNKPPEPQLAAAVTPPPAPEPPRLEPPRPQPAPARIVPRRSGRRDIVIVR
jgi:hypothetical protein